MRSIERHLIILAGGFAVLSILLFTAVILLRPPLLMHPESRMESGTIPVALLSFGLLAGDVFLPIPSSILMTVNGRLFGFWMGAGISLAGYLVSGMVGYAVGHSFKRLITRAASESELKKADSLVSRWGLFAVILTRPIPILAETVTICAGAARMPFRRFVLGAFAGTLPITLIYAAAGAFASTFSAGLISAAAVLVLSGLAWAAGRRTQSIA